MLGKIGMSVVFATALFLGAVRLPAAQCILSNAPIALQFLADPETVEKANDFWVFTNQTAPLPKLRATMISRI